MKNRINFGNKFLSFTLKVLPLVCLMIMLQSASSFAALYARIKYVNNGTLDYATWSYHDRGQWSDIYVEIFEDIECTIPAYSEENQTVIIRPKSSNYQNIYNWNSGYSSDFSIEIPANSQSVQIEYAMNTWFDHQDFYQSNQSYSGYQWYEILSFTGDGIAGSENQPTYWVY
ncbi:hypothetical protein [Desertivirga xinjiangensis]|uniref:hypothetical protein n=1 Tax=Desertivirga xinjiangensis TaxID=539206 RepID=UPI00210C1BBF|nr:hypothetical protein [Pedobacter xinjiangensis]